MSLSSQILSYFNKTFQLFQVLWADVVHQDPKALCHFWHGLLGVLGLHVLRGVLLHVLLLEQEWWNVQLCKLQHHRRHLLHLPLHLLMGNQSAHTVHSISLYTLLYQNVLLLNCPHVKYANGMRQLYADSFAFAQSCTPLDFSLHSLRRLIIKILQV